MFRNTLSAGLIAVALLGLAGCRGSENGGASGDEILVGHFGSMTGSEATFGQSTDNGIKLAIEEINAAGGIRGKQIRLITYDDKGDAKEAGTAVTRLVTRDKVTVVLGEVSSSLSLAGAPVCQEHGVPMITPSSTNERVTMVGDMIFRVCFVDSFQGYAAAKFSREMEPKPAEVAGVLYDQAAAYSSGLAKEFQKHFEAMGGKVSSVQTYTAGDQDFTAQLTAIRGTNPDVIFVPGYYTDVGNIAQQARKLGIKAPLVGGDGWDSSKLTEIGGDAINGSFYTNHYSHQDPAPHVQEFSKKYKAKFGGTPDGLAALGYDAMILLSQAMKRANSLGGKDLAAAIAESQNFQGVTGNISIDAHRNAIKPAVILEVVDGQPTYVRTIEPPQ